MLNKLSPGPHEAERRLTIRKRRSEGREILPSCPFKIKLEEKRQAKVNKADHQRKRKGTRGKNCLNKSQETKSHTASKRRLQSSAQVDSKVDRPKETECIISGKYFDEDWIQCTFVISGLMKTVQTQKETLFFLIINVIFAKLKLTFNCFAI
jgi:hypothetical protein